MHNLTNAGPLVLSHIWWYDFRNCTRPQAIVHHLLNRCLEQRGIGLKWSVTTWLIHAQHHDALHLYGGGVVVCDWLCNRAKPSIIYHLADNKYDHLTSTLACPTTSLHVSFIFFRWSDLGFQLFPGHSYTKKLCLRTLPARTKPVVLMTVSSNEPHQQTRMLLVEFWSGDSSAWNELTSCFASALQFFQLYCSPKTALDVGKSIPGRTSCHRLRCSILLYFSTWTIKPRGVVEKGKYRESAKEVKGCFGCPGKFSAEANPLTSTCKKA